MGCKSNPNRHPAVAEVVTRLREVGVPREEIDVTTRRGGRYVISWNMGGRTLRICAGSRSAESGLLHTCQRLKTVLRKAGVELRA